MSSRQRWSRSLIASATVVLATVTGLPAAEVPPALDAWRDWVLEGQEHLRCPFLGSGSYGDPAQHACAWPQRLRLVTGAGGGRFSIAYTAFVATWLPLPGDSEHWPLSVRVDGTAQPVVEHGGGPALRVAAGSHQVEGELEWERRPESLRVPELIAAVELVLDGQPVFPLQRSGAWLWLGKAEAAAGQADSLDLQVFRLLSDGLPPLLETRLRLNVSGQGREEVLGPVLPAGFAPTAVTSTLPVLLDGVGRLRVQLRPGNWQAVVHARGLAPLATVELGLPGGSWPAQEIWSYQSAPELRVTAASGATPIDPSQVDVPEEWTQLPAFALADRAQLVVEERSRGMAEDANRLTLHRELWLDFSGAGMTARDSIGGRMVRDFRLDLAPPFELRRAQSDGEPLLVTAGAEPGLTGIELRNPQVNLSASSRLERAGGAMPITGWRASFEAVSVGLYLPPGRELVAALGTDSSPQAWLDRWSLLDVFLLLITTLLAVRLLGRRWGAVTGAFLALSYHESVGPLLCLLVLLILGLLRRALPAGRLAKALTAASVGMLVVLALVCLPFVARELRLALYPQLEVSAVGTWSGPAVPTLAGGELNVQQEAQAAPTTVLRDEVSDKTAEVQGIFLQKRAPATAEMMRRYASSNVVQAGGGEPAWQWRQASLTWSGPVAPDQSLRLLITPPWLTRLLRVLLVGLLAALVGRLALTLKLSSDVATSPPAAAALVLLGLALTAPAGAQQTPDAALLETLRQRLTRAPECAPACGRIEQAVIEAARDRLQVTLVVHAAALVAVPVPACEAVWQVERVRVDGVDRGELLRQEGGTLLVPMERGVHRVELSGPLAAADNAEMRFPMAPARVVARGEGWDFGGLRGGRLLTDTLVLVRARRATGREEVEGAAVRVPPFVRVQRLLDLDLDWTVTTTVTRVAPQDGSLAVEVPLLPGESVLTPGFEVRDGRVTVAIGAGIGEVAWQSRLERVEQLELAAADLAARSEAWIVTVSPQWSASFSGVPPTYPAGVTDFWVHEFHPLPGERLLIGVGRPEAVAGATLAIDAAELESRVGRRAREHSLTLDLRSTRGGQHALRLPAAAEVLDVTLDGTVVNVRPDEGKLALPVHPGEQRLTVRWRDATGAGIWAGTPEVDLGASASNLRITLQPGRRWVLATSGPRLGPAVLYWGELAVMALVALLLARLRRSPLGARQWLLLGLGFSTFSWLALVVVVVWLLALDARSRLTDGLPWVRFNLLQLALVALTGAALICLLAAIPYGLLGTPDMHVVGNGSDATTLRWFADLSPGQMPRGAALSLPIGVYRLAMLGWALWLASAIVGWLRWGWQCLTTSGGWRRRQQSPAVPQAEGPA